MEIFSSQYFIYYWLWRFLFRFNAALPVLVCSQCSTTCHSACLRRYISHLVFGILPVGSLMLSWQTVCHQVWAAGHLKPLSLLMSESGPKLNVWISVCVCFEKCTILWGDYELCICVIREVLWVKHKRCKLGIKFVHIFMTWWAKSSCPNYQKLSQPVKLIHVFSVGVCVRPYSCRRPSQVQDLGVRENKLWEYCHTNT